MKAYVRENEIPSMILIAYRLGWGNTNCDPKIPIQFIWYAGRATSVLCRNT